MASFHTPQLKYALGLGGIMSFYGVVSIIVMMLPAGSMGKNTRIVTIALILLTMPFVMLFGYLASRRKRKAEEKKAAEKEAAAAGGTQPPETVQKQAPAAHFQDIDAGSEEAVQFIKSSNLGSAGKEAVYSLPWYIVAGAPRSGKSSFVLSSNLDFQALPSQRQSELKFVRPTRNVDWRITNEAVFIDTAGRYQSEGVDGEEWSALLENVRKQRPNRAIDGFILVINCESILKGNERAVEEMAKTLRARLDDAMQRLKVNFPVYVVFTNADSIEGFRDSFSTSKNEDKTLVWGSTIPLEKSANAQALFDGEYEILHDSLMKRRIARLSAPFPPVRQLRIFNFPLHFGSARRKFGAFINTLFRPNPFSQNPFLRGFYFAAAPPSKSGGAPTIGASYFSERLFRDVILRDKDLVRTFIAQRQRPPIMGWLLTLLGAFLVTAFLTLAGVSLWSNRQMLADAQTRGEQVLTLRKADANKDILAKNESETRAEMETLRNFLALLTQLDDYERNSPPLYMRFGLYSGNRVYNNAMLPIYYSMVEQRFRNPTIKRMEADLRKFSATSKVANPGNLSKEEEDNLDKHYKLLKAYLMISGGKYKLGAEELEFRDKAEPTEIMSAVEEYWVTESKVPEDQKAAALQHLEFWVKQVDRKEGSGRFPFIALDQKLVEEAREKLRAFPAEYRYYSRKVSEVSKEIDDTIGPTTVDAILTRNGTGSTYMEGRYRVPGAFTRAGYDPMIEAIGAAAEEIGKDDWVMGEQGRRDLSTTADSTRIQERYHRDYADHWRNFVRGIDIRSYQNKDDAAGALQEFSLTNSPIKIVAQDIARNTNLSAPPENPGIIAWVMSFISRRTSTETGNSEPERQFRPLFTFVGTADQQGNAAMDSYLSQLSNLGGNIATISEDRFKAAAQEMAAEKDPLKISNSEKAITSLIAGFKETPSSQDMASLLQRPLDNLKALLGSGIRQQIEKQWNEQILAAAKTVERGYPFEDSTDDTNITALTEFLNPATGRFSQFYDQQLARYFEESGGVLKVKETSELKFSDEFVAYLNNVMAIRRALYGSSPTPKFDYEFTLQPVTGGMVEVTLDGQKVTSEGTGSFKATFPSATAETGVLINMVSMGGSPPPLSPPPPSAANSNSATASAQQRTFPGTWGLFRFVDASNPQKQPGGEYSLSFAIGGSNVSATIKPTGGDVFDRNMFRQTRAPQSFLK